MSKKTPFYKIHKKYSARMVDFAGFEMPVHYKNGIIHEHRKVRNSVGMFDLSHMGEFIVKGPKALEFLQKTTVNNVADLKLKQVQYTNMCYPDGGIVDDLLIYRDEKHYLLVVNASNISKDFDWLQNNIIDGVELNNVSDETALIAVQGPNSQEVVQNITEEDLSELKYYWFLNTRTDEGVDILISRTGYTGEDGFEIYFKDLTQAEIMWEKVKTAGKKFNIEPIGLGARDTLRLEMKYPLYGNDIDENTNPLEAGLRWIVKFDKKDFIGKNALLKVKKERIKRKLIAFVMQDKGIPRPHYKLYKNGRIIGDVRSGTLSPSLNIGIGTGYVAREYRKSGNEIKVGIRKRIISAKIIKPPFYKEGSIKR